MPLDTSGALLEGIRISEGNNPFSYPPRSLASDPSQLNAVTQRAEYVLVTHCVDPSKQAVEIADPDLRFRWTRNDPGVLRFSYDSFGKRWLPSPGSSPDELGKLSNEDRLTMPVPDPSNLSAPFSVYVGSPVRQLTFSVQVVGSADDFTPPASLPAGTLQVSAEDGKINFSQADVDAYGGRTVLSQRQNFFDRTKTTGRFGVLPASSSVEYHVFLNPLPASGQVPLVRIGYGRQLVAVEVANEGSLGSPAPGTFAWAADTGRVRFSDSDVDALAGEGVYYDGVAVGTVQPAATPVGASVPAWPSPAFSVATDSVGYIDQRYVVYAELAGRPRVYWTVSVVPAAPASRPRNGTAVLDSSTGNVYLSSRDVSRYAGYSYSHLDSLMSIEDGVSVQVFRSTVNGSGPEQKPDFTILYFVEDQIVVDGIIQAPFVMLPTTPVVDDVLSYRIDQGPSSSGTFTGPLADGTDPSRQGLGYLLNLDAHQLNFDFRKTVGITLQKPTPAVKLADAAISERGFVVTENGSPVVPGTDFDFDAGTGLLTFTEPFGQNDPSDVEGIKGDAQLPSFFQASGPSFSASSAGSYLLVTSGPNVGIRRISSLVDPSRVAVDPPFVQARHEFVDLKSEADVLADRFFVEVDPPFKKFSLAKAPAGSSAYSQVPTDEFSVFANVGQVNLVAPAGPGESFLVTYVALTTDDDGATYTPVNTVEKALFKVRQETATSTPGSPTVTFNPDGRPVSTARPFAVYVSGVPLAAGFFEFHAPGTLVLSDPVPAGKTVVLDYWVEVALGGETSFDLLNQPIDVDFALVSAGSSSTAFNGDQTALVSAGSVLFVSDKEALVVATSVYDPLEDVTDVTFTAPAVFDSDGGAILSCAPLGDGYFVSETAIPGSFVSGSNVFRFPGDLTSSYRLGTVVLLDGDPYYCIGSQFQDGFTRVTTAAPARRNYIVPSVLRTVRPLFLPGRQFQTTLQADLDFEFTLVRNGPRAAVLVRDVDYAVTGGGSVTMTEDAVFGDSLYALYVAQDPRPAGTAFVLNYAYAVAPSSSNGLLGQRLVATYNLYAPDTFFYRVETIRTFLPEVQDMLKSGSQSSSGPNTGNATGMSNKDFGRPSLYYDEQHENNLDIEIARLLLFYNDLINLYEDALSDLDGRIVGGRSGRFRFDDRFDNPPRTSYSQVTNDIDDQVLLYSRLRLTGFFTFEEVPVYGNMATPNSLSRIFPTAGTKATALNDKTGVLDFGKALGSIGVDNLRGVGLFKSSRSNSFFSTVSGTAYTVDVNGDAEHGVPQFQVGEDVQVYEEDGAPSGSPAQVLSVSGTGPYVVTLSAGTSLARGSLLKDLSDSSNPTNHFYQPGRDLSVDLENGQVSNMYLGGIPLFPQTQVAGNEVCDVPITFGNSDIEPLRIPALDGDLLNDDGSVPAPRLRRTNESMLLADESVLLDNLGNGSTATGTAFVGPTLVDVFGATFPVAVGDVVLFTAGPNSGESRVVTLIVSATQFRVGSPFSSQDTSPSAAALMDGMVVNSGTTPSVGQSFTFLDGPSAGATFTVNAIVPPGVLKLSDTFSSVDPGSNYLVAVSGDQVLTDVVSQELAVLNDNAAAPAVPPSLIAQVDSEIATATSLSRFGGPTVATGSGTTTSNTLTDPGAQFSLAGAVAGCLVYVPSGPNRGLYSVSAVTSHVLTVDTDDPYAAFPSPGPGIPYEVIVPESFIESDQFGPVSRYLRETLAFYGSTLAWSSSLGPSGIPARVASIAERQSQISGYFDDFSAALVDEGLYDIRYLWIDQRTNRKTGNFVKKRQAAQRRVENTRKLVKDQKKLLISEKIK